MVDAHSPSCQSLPAPVRAPPPPPWLVNLLSTTWTGPSSATAEDINGGPLGLPRA